MAQVTYQSHILMSNHLKSYHASISSYPLYSLSNDLNLSPQSIMIYNVEVPINLIFNIKDITSIGKSNLLNIIELLINMVCIHRNPLWLVWVIFPVTNIDGGYGVSSIGFQRESNNWEFPFAGHQNCGSLCTLNTYNIQIRYSLHSSKIFIIKSS